MDIYAAKLAGSESYHGSGSWQPAAGDPGTPLNSWMELSLTVEEKQYVIFIRKLSPHDLF